MRAEYRPAGAERALTAVLCLRGRHCLTPGQRVWLKLHTPVEELSGGKLAPFAQDTHTQSVFSH